MSPNILWPLDLSKSWKEIGQQLGNDKAQLAVFATIWIVILGKDVVHRLGRGLPPRVPLLSRWWRWRPANAAWRRAAAAWLAQPGPPDVSNLRPEALKKDLEALAAEREARIRACAVFEPEAEQRTRYLATFRIEAAKLPNIGPARCAVLRSWGIDTAADVDEGKIADIPG